MPITSTAGGTIQLQPAKMKWGRLRKVAATGIAFVIVIVTVALSKGFVRALSDQPTNATAPVNVFDKFDKPAGPWNRNRATPSLQEFLEKARPLNPGSSDSALTEYWLKNYSESPAPFDDYLRRAAAKELVEKSHPGWESTIKTTKFTTWLAAQSEQTRKRAEGDDPADAIRLLDKFAVDTK